VTLPIYSDPPANITVTFDLIYLEEYQYLGLLSYIQDVRSRAILIRTVGGERETATQAFQQEARYWEQLTESTQKLVAEVSRLRTDFDLIVDPPSNTGYHRPYLAAFRTVFPNALSCYFVKTKSIEAGSNSVSFADLSAKTDVRKRPYDNLRECKSILIVDDIFSTGLTSSVIVQKLSSIVHENAQFTVACPLKMSAQNHPDNLHAIIAEMATE
jgi:hypothetical protein